MKKYLYSFIFIDKSSNTPKEFYNFVISLPKNRNKCFRTFSQERTSPKKRNFRTLYKKKKFFIFY